MLDGAATVPGESAQALLGWERATAFGVGVVGEREEDAEKRPLGHFGGHVVHGPLQCLHTHDSSLEIRFGFRLAEITERCRFVLWLTPRVRRRQRSGGSARIARRHGSRIAIRSSRATLRLGHLRRRILERWADLIHLQFHGRTLLMLLALPRMLRQPALGRPHAYPSRDYWRNAPPDHPTPCSA